MSNNLIFEQWIKISEHQWELNIQSKNSRCRDSWWTLTVLQISPDKSPENTPNGMCAYKMWIVSFPYADRPLYEYTYFCESLYRAKFEAINKMFRLLNKIIDSTRRAWMNTIREEKEENNK